MLVKTAGKHGWHVDGAALPIPLYAPTVLFIPTTDKKYVVTTVVDPSLWNLPKPAVNTGYSIRQRV